MTNRISRRAIACALLATTSLTLPAVAAAETPAPRFVDTIDDHGVDLVTGLPFLQIEEGGIGSGPGRISMQRIWSEGAGFLDNWTGGLYAVTTNNVTTMYVQFAGISDTFSGSGTSWTSTKAEGATLVVDPVSFQWTYTARDGTKVVFSEAGDKAWNCPGANPTSCQVPLSITAPNGLKFTLTWQAVENNLGIVVRRLSNVASSAGYGVTFTYVSSVLGPDWHKRASATFDNSVNHPNPLPTMTYAYPNSTTVTVTDPANRTWTFTLDTGGRLTGVKRPGSSSNNITYSYVRGAVSSSTKDGVTNTYSLDAGEMLVTNPLSQQTLVAAYTGNGRPTNITDPLNHTTGFQYDTNSRLTRINAPEGNAVQYDYDVRGNVVTQTLVPKTGSGLSNIVTSASYDATCLNIVTCNKPNSTTDAKGNVTNYTYDPMHGGVTSVTQPAPLTGGIRPQTRYSYTQVAGAGGQSVYMPTKVAACQTLASCAGAADEAQVLATYNSNLLPTSVTRQDGTSTLVSTSTLAYDARGRVDTVDGPLSGTADTTKYRYDSADQLIGVTSPDPDGAGALKNRAIRLTYRSDGQASKQELGTVNSQSDADWALFAPLQTVDLTFDTNNRPVASKLSASGTAYALTQTSYDALGRVDCSAVRMNTAVYGSLPASACTLGTQGSFGPDRIGQLVYDAAGEVTQVKAAVGTADAATERTLTYTNNGLVSTLLDAENNKTTYVYDGFDRLSKTQYPTAMPKGAGTSNAADYEQLSYDANGNVTAHRLRNANTITLSYDKLDRLTQVTADPLCDRTYTYDLLGRLLTAGFITCGETVTNSYDALSRLSSTSTNAGGTARALTYQYDLAGRRTRVTWWDGFYVDYDRLVTGELGKARENGATTGVGVLATYAYDNLGNRTSVTFGNGAAQAFAYDPVSRLSSLTNDLSGTANDLTETFAYNPASQIASTARTGDAYAFTGLTSGTTNSTANGLNQQATINGSTVGWDSLGNLTADPSTGNSYAYDLENRLASGVSGGTTRTLSYDPLGRLDRYNPGTATRFVYDGVQAAAEIDTDGAIQDRYVMGDGPDEVLVDYAGSGTANRRFLGADERGSVISLTDVTGALIGINTYDEYGKPTATNTGRFQYTGQKWLSEIGAYDYKARVYLPHLGVFAQTDPIGYADSPNLYGYVHSDPINGTDPLGFGCPALGLSAGENCPSSQPEPPPLYVTGIRACSSGAICIYPNAQGLPVNVVDNRPVIVTGYRPKQFVVQLPGLPIPIDICPIVGLLGQTGRLRLGADAAGGYFGFLRGGLGVSLRGDLSLGIVEIHLELMMAEQR